LTTEFPEDVRYELVDGYPVLRFRYLGGEAEVWGHDRCRGGWVYLGPGMEGKVKYVLPANATDGRLAARVVDGATDDPAVLAIVERFLAAVDAGHLEPSAVEPQ